MEKQELPPLIEAYLKLDEEAEPLYCDLGEPWPNENTPKLNEIHCKQAHIKNILHKNFHMLFEHWALRSYIELLQWPGYDICIGKSRINESEPQDVIYLYERLKEIDDALENRELIYVSHMLTTEDYWCCQMWLATPEIHTEYQKDYDKRLNLEYGENRFIPISLFVLAPFLEKYCDDARLIEIWAGPF